MNNNIAGIYYILLLVILGLFFILVNKILNFINNQLEKKSKLINEDNNLICLKIGEINRFNDIKSYDCRYYSFTIHKAEYNPNFTIKNWCKNCKLKYPTLVKLWNE